MAQPRAYFVNRKMQTEVQRVGTRQSFPKLIVITPLILQTHNLQFIKVSFTLRSANNQHADYGQVISCQSHYRPVGGFGVENVFLSLAGTLLDLLLAELALELLSVSSSPLPEKISIYKTLQYQV